jgi:hypothetical protein
MVRGYRDIGIGYLESDATGTTTKYGARTVLNFDFGIAAGSSRQDISGSDVLTYPCQGVTEASKQVPNEVPNPVPGRDLTTNPLGHPVLVAVRYGQTLAITSATMTNVATGAAVTLRAPITAAKDANSGQLLRNEGFILPDAALSANTSYQVTMNGTNNGTAFSRTFTFSTGAGSRGTTRGTFRTG